MDAKSNFNNPTNRTKEKVFTKKVRVMPELNHKSKEVSDGKKQARLKKVRLLQMELEAFSEDGFTGYVKVNFSQGSIGRIEKFEEILREIKEKG